MKKNLPRIRPAEQDFSVQSMGPKEESAQRDRGLIEEEVPDGLENWEDSTSART